MPARFAILSRLPLWSAALSVFLCAGQALAAAPVAKLTVVRAVVAGQSVSAKLLASDADGNPLTYSIIDPPAIGTVTLDDANTGAFTWSVPYSIEPGAQRRVTFTFKVNDGTSDSTVQTVYLTALPRGNKVMAVGDNTYGQSSVSEWSDVVAVAAGYYHTVGLKADGTVVAVGPNAVGELNVGDWRDVVAVAAGAYHTLGLKTDGTVVAVGGYGTGHLNVGGWSNVVAVAGGGSHTVGLRADGTVLAVGSNAYGQTNVGGWSNVVAVAAGGAHTVGLKADGTVVAVGDNSYGQLNADSWSNVVSVAAMSPLTVGLKADGTVVAVGSGSSGQLNVDSWSDVVAVGAGGYHSVGIGADGKVVAVGYNGYGQLNVGDWSAVVAAAGGGYVTVGLKANAAPVASAVTLYVEPDSAAATGNLVALGSDADGDTLAFGSSSNGSHGTVTDNGDGTLTYTPSAGFEGSDSFTYSVSDHITSSVPAVVTVHVSTDWDGDGITNADESADGTNPLAPTTAKPRFSAAGGSYRDRVSITLESSTAGATLRYTLDGTDPSPANGTKVASGTVVVLTTSATLKAMAYKAGLDNSAISSAAYGITHPGGGGGSCEAAGIGALLLVGLRRRRADASRM